MKVLEYADLDVSRVRAAYAKVVEALERDDFRSAEVKKLASVSHGKYFRAKLDHTNRVLFTTIRHGATTYILMLEIIEQHAYDRSRFLRGAAIDESRIPDADATEATQSAELVRYIHPGRMEVQLLDKPISFDEAQAAVYRMQPPLIIVGSAGSGKTALTLEKMKCVDGDILYVTHSSYLAQGAAEAYRSYGFERAAQDVTFFSYRAFLESLRVPEGREATWRDFSAWFERNRAFAKGLDPHQVFEELRGVIAAQAEGVLDHSGYLALGVKQSIFLEAERERVYALFEKYRTWLAESGLYDQNLVAHAWKELAQPRYDFVVVDEVQDLTMAQLALVLKTLRKAGRFMLCGDSNQIVHPNFFAWSRVKTLFWADEALAGRQELKVLQANFRNGQEATRVANALLKIKQLRFGSIDRESNFLVRSVSLEPGRVRLVPDQETFRKELDEKTRGSAQVAVLVLRDEDKPEARRFFHTPLVFSVHEAKGLEYDRVILYRFVSGSRAAYASLAEGVEATDLERDELDYRRGRDKTDKSLEIHKFFVNALYVAITRAIREVYLVEQDTEHPLFGLLGLRTEAEALKLEAKTSSLEDWQKEAHRLESQGKQEQAEAIRQTLLHQKEVPWTVLDAPGLERLLAKVFVAKAPGRKPAEQLAEFASFHGEAILSTHLANLAGTRAASQVAQESLQQRILAPFASRKFRDVLRQCEEYGLEYHIPMGLTPLMAASAAGNVELVEALLDLGAGRDSTDHFGRNAFHWALIRAFRDDGYARETLPLLVERLAPPVIDLMESGRLVRLAPHQSEYLLFQTLWTLFSTVFRYYDWRGRFGLTTAQILAPWSHLPPSVLRPERNQRQHLSAVLSRNEVDREYAYNRRLFKRVQQGWYVLNPRLSVRQIRGATESWVPLPQVLNLALAREFAQPAFWEDMDAFYAAAGLPEPPPPILQQPFEAAEAERARTLAARTGWHK